MTFEKWSCGLLQHLYVCVCVFVSIIYTYGTSRIHYIYKHTQTRGSCALNPMCVCVRLCACISVWVSVWLCACVGECICVYVCVCVCTYNTHKHAGPAHSCGTCVCKCAFMYILYIHGQQIRSIIYRMTHKHVHTIRVNTYKHSPAPLCIAAVGVRQLCDNWDVGTHGLGVVLWMNSNKSAL